MLLHQTRTQKTDYKCTEEEEMDLLQHLVTQLDLTQHPEEAIPLLFSSFQMYFDGPPPVQGLSNEE